MDQLALKLNSLAWDYFEFMNDPADLNQAVAWSAQSLEVDREPAFLDTYAQLLGRLGRKVEAVSIEQEAIGKLKAYKQPTESYEKTLAFLRK